MKESIEKRFIIVGCQSRDLPGSVTIGFAVSDKQFVNAIHVEEAPTTMTDTEVIERMLALDCEYRTRNI